MHRHGYKGRKFSLKKEPRELLLRNLATSLILHEKIKTTLPKAKEVQPIVEKMITLGKENNLESDRRIHGYLTDKQAALKLKAELVDLYKDRSGGYTRVTKFGYRVGDNAKMAIIELIDTDKLDHKIEKAKKKQDKPKSVNESKNKVSMKSKTVKNKA